MSEVSPIAQTGFPRLIQNPSRPNRRMELMKSRAELYEYHASECVRDAAQTDDPKRREMACTRFRGHRVRCHSGAGGGLWNANAMHENSSLRL